MSSPFAQGGLVLGALAGVVASLRSIPGRVWTWFRDRFTTTVTIKQSDPLFRWISFWLASHAYSQKCRSLLASTELRTRSYRDYASQSMSPALSGETSSDDKPPEIDLSPAHGRHVLRWHGLWIVMNRQKEGDGAKPSDGMVGSSSSMSDFMRLEEIVLTFGTTDRNKVLELLEDARQLSNPPGKPKTHIYTNSYYDWSTSNELPYRSSESIILPTEQYENITADIDKFFTNKEFYERTGMPHRRGYLWYGIPGAGKTSLIRALASKYRSPLYVLNLADSQCSDSCLTRLLSNIRSERAFVVIEDIDSYFDGRTPKSSELKITFSGLLNAMDGAASCEGHILFLTTNHKEGLDPALIRPGRVDYELEFTYATDEQIRRMYSRFRPISTTLDYQLFEKALGSKFPDNRVTTAQLQGFLYGNEDGAFFQTGTLSETH